MRTVLLEAYGLALFAIAQAGLKIDDGTCHRIVEADLTTAAVDVHIDENKTVLHLETDGRRRYREGLRGHKVEGFGGCIVKILSRIEILHIRIVSIEVEAAFLWQIDRFTFKKPFPGSVGQDTVIRPVA